MEAALKTLRLLWMGIFSSSMLFFVLSIVLKPEHEAPGLTFALILGGVALTMAFAATAVPLAMYRSALRRVVIPTKEVEDPTQIAGLARRRVVANPEAAVGRVLSAFSAPFVLGLALSESVGLFGFVLGFLGFSLPVIAPFFVACWALLVSKFPTPRGILGPAERVIGAQLTSAGQAHGS